ncbi:uncharacterized protein CLUP02_10652 [Colletotrichum lupini]|uniref:Uncharacterized protein n=1 Tax=Colletotrichum lupini TaxID=145971 RepID=A0A9Q8SX52_9PEZI|nr:uncharacterized protein CLUP02_10652 [Colletotrichum lupini]UQC85156.1 hypothetical protein CLUP02_10652 [Colletotrichum lupini]
MKKTGKIMFLQRLQDKNHLSKGKGERGAEMMEQRMAAKLVIIGKWLEKSNVCCRLDAGRRADLKMASRFSLHFQSLTGSAVGGTSSYHIWHLRLNRRVLGNRSIYRTGGRDKFNILKLCLNGFTFVKKGGRNQTWPYTSRILPLEIHESNFSPFHSGKLPTQPDLKNSLQTERPHTAPRAKRAACTSRRQFSDFAVVKSQNHLTTIQALSHREGEGSDPKQREWPGREHPSNSGVAAAMPAHLTSIPTLTAAGCCVSFFPLSPKPCAGILAIKQRIGISHWGSPSLFRKKIVQSHFGRSCFNREHTWCVTLTAFKPHELPLLTMHTRSGLGLEGLGRFSTNRPLTTTSKNVQLAHLDMKTAQAYYNPMACNPDSIGGGHSAEETSNWEQYGDTFVL